MINIVVIGRMGEGKTTFVKKFIHKKRAIVFDVNNEYDFTQDNRAEISRVTDLNHKDFINRCLNKRNTCCVFEDATGFIEGRLSDRFRQMLVSKRHTGNANILIFHSVLSVPPRALQLCDYVILFKTNDEDYQVENKYPSLVKQFRQLRNEKKYSYKIIKL